MDNLFNVKKETIKIVPLIAGAAFGYWVSDSKGEIGRNERSVRMEITKHVPDNICSQKTIKFVM